MTLPVYAAPNEGALTPDPDLPSFLSCDSPTRLPEHRPKHSYDFNNETKEKRDKYKSAAIRFTTKPAKDTKKCKTEPGIKETGKDVYQDAGHHKQQPPTVHHNWKSSSSVAADQLPKEDTQGRRRSVYKAVASEPIFYIGSPAVPASLESPSLGCVGVEKSQHLDLQLVNDGSEYHTISSSAGTTDEEVSVPGVKSQFDSDVSTTSEASRVWGKSDPGRELSMEFYSEFLGRHVSTTNKHLPMVSRPYRVRITHSAAERCQPVYNYDMETIQGVQARETVRHWQCPFCKLPREGFRRALYRVFCCVGVCRCENEWCPVVSKTERETELCRPSNSQQEVGQHFRSSVLPVNKAGRARATDTVH